MAQPRDPHFDPSRQKHNVCLKKFEGQVAQIPRSER